MSATLNCLHDSSELSNCWLCEMDKKEGFVDSVSYPESFLREEVHSSVGNIRPRDRISIHNHSQTYHLKTKNSIKTMKRPSTKNVIPSGGSMRAVSETEASFKDVSGLGGGGYKKKLTR